MMRFSLQGHLCPESEKYEPYRQAGAASGLEHDCTCNIIEKWWLSAGASSILVSDNCFVAALLQMALQSLLCFNP